MRLIKIMTLLVATLAYGVATADPILAVDFRDAAWDGADNNASYTVYGVTAIAHGGNLWHNEFDGDGLGIRGGEHDEIDGDEWLEILIADGYLVTGVFLTDLFNAPDGANEGETGWVELWAAGNVLLGTHHFHQEEETDNGEFWLVFGDAYEVVRLVFGGNGQDGHEYSVGGLTGIEEASVPEPGTLAMLGLGLMMLGLARRRRAIAASA